MIILQIVGAVLVADFLSGLFHWLEDAYGRENWPITGRLITQPNILHHQEARYFTRYSWFESSWILLCLGLFVLVIAWLCGALTWQVWLVVILGVNANQVHKWAHRTPKENGPLISLLQRVGLVQTARHHAHHHTDPKNSHYCVLTNVVNPLVDGARLWDGFEWVIRRVFRVRRRIDTSVLAYQQKQVSPRHVQNQSQARRLPMPVRH
jgi:plasmanylethanolamine desaturase